MSATTFPLPSVARHAARLKDMFRFGRSRATRRQEDAYTAQLAKDVLSRDDSRVKAVEHVVSLVVDIARRGTEEDAAAIGEALIAIARVEWAAANPAPGAPRLSRAEAHMAEERAQGDRENAEVAMSNFPTLGNMLRFLGADAAYERAARELREAVRREVAAQ